MQNNFKEDIKVFKALSDENRLLILELLKNGEKCACILLEKLNIGQPTLSYHMKILSDAGIVVSRQESKWTYYSISEKGCETVSARLKDLMTSVCDRDTAAGC